jgi:hypothetical protein
VWRHTLLFDDLYSFKYIPKGRIAESYHSCNFSFLLYLHTDFYTVILVYILSNSVWGILPSHPHIINECQSDYGVMESYCSLHLRFPYGQGCRTCLLCLLAIHISSSERCLFNSLLHLLIRLNLLMFNFLSSFCIPDICLIQWIAGKDFLPLCGLSLLSGNCYWQSVEAF